MNRKCLTAFGLCLFSLIIILPTLIHGYIYPNLGDDSAEHIKVFELMRTGQPYDANYIRFLGYVLIGYPLVWINQLTHISLPTVYLWFCYLSLIGVGLTLYFVTSKLVNRVAGWLSIIVVLFCAHGISYQFYYGQIFNLINMGIILPWIIYFCLKQEITNGFYALVVLSFLFGAFHASGIYLPVVALLVCIGLFSLQNKFRGSYFNYFIPAGCVFVTSAIGWLIFSRQAIGGSQSLISSLPIPFLPYIYSVIPIDVKEISVTVLILVVFSIFFYKDILKSLSEEAKVLVIILLTLATVLFGAFVLRILSDPFRQVLDFATVSGWIIAILVGPFIVKNKNKVLIGVLCAFIALGFWSNLTTWFSYNSAIQEPDKRAIEYLNSNNVSQYNANSLVAAWVYERFTPARISQNSSVIVIRDSPMTPRSDPTSEWFDNRTISIPLGYKVKEAYSDGNVTVNIWGEK